MLRGGDLGGRTSRDKNLNDVYRAYGIWGICVAAEPGKSVDEIAAYRKFGNRTMMTGLSFELRAAGFGVIQEPGKTWPNALITFAGEPNAETWDRLRAMMLARPMLPNPGYKGK